MPLYNISLTRKTDYLLVLFLHTIFPRSDLAKVGSYAGCECVGYSLGILLSPYISENRGFGNPLPKFGMGGICLTLFQQHCESFFGASNEQAIAVGA